MPEQLPAKHKNLVQILLGITSLDDDFSLADVADLIDKNRFYGMDEFGRVIKLNADAKKEVYDVLKNHRRMLIHKEYRGPNRDINIWNKYADELAGSILSLDENGLLPLMYRLWIASTDINSNQVKKKAQTTRDKRENVIRDWIKENSEDELHAVGKLNAWNNIFAPIAPKLFPYRSDLGDNSIVSKAFNAAGIIFPSGRPLKK
jgi:hypothetical protein